MNYKIIKDERKLIKFIDWLPELKYDETYYVCLFARSKYCNNQIKTDKQQLKRFTSKKDYLYNKIRQLQIEYGAYKYRDKDVPQEALALYINPNPRSFEKAARKSLKEFVYKVTEPYNGYNPHQLVMSNIQRCSSKKRFMDFDFDFVKYDFLVNSLKNVINDDAYKILKTRGGFHVLVEIDKINFKFKKSWYNSIRDIKGCDISGDNLILVVGCTQGDFIPHFVK